MTARSQKPGPGARGPSRPPSFSRPVDVRRLPDAGSRHDLEASEAERVALAGAFGVPAIGSLRARFELCRRAGGRVTVRGEVDALVTQLCVVTLEAFESLVAQDVDLVFAPETPEQLDDRRRRDQREAEPASRTVPGSDDQVDPPDAIIDDTIDLGVIASEFTALALDPYPRKPGAAFADVTDPGDADEPSAFAVLERLKARP